MGIYALQAARYLSGQKEPISVVAVETKTDTVKFKEVDESLGFTLKFPSGVLAVCSTSYATRFQSCGPDQCRRRMVRVGPGV